MHPATAEIQQLLFQLHRALDAHDYPGLVRCFDTEGAWMRQDKPVQGHAAISAAMAQRSTTLATSHHLANLMVEGSAEQAEASYALTVYMQDDGKPASLPLGKATLQAGRARAVVTRRDGTWRVSLLETAAPTFRLPCG